MCTQLCELSLPASLPAIREDSINCRIQCIFSIRGIHGDSVGGGFKAGETNEKHF